MKTNRHFSQGLTLIELMVVIAVIVVSLLLSIPSISGYLDERKIRNVAESLYYGMQKARTVAVNTNDPTELVWSGKVWQVWRIDTVTGGYKSDDPKVPTPPKAVEIFNWDTGGDHDWSSVVVTTVPASSQATVTFSGGDGRLEFPDPSGALMPNAYLTQMPPSRFVVTGRLANSRPMWVTIGVGGGIRVCDPQLPTSDPKGCVCDPTLPATSPGGCGSG
ncbi:MAG: prepilin-type N-terminal cleavage/methylation domain-containing protein [Betaproteobacteria bacterium]|nr:prepilin-type N-terminal cleavage/methylation domain-containing protein [Betaproteobacteria bacterium]